MTNYIRTAAKVKKKLKAKGGPWLLDDRGPNTGTEDRPVYASPTVTKIYGVRSTSAIRSPEGLVTGHASVLLVPADAPVSIGDVLRQGDTHFKVGDIDYVQPGQAVVMQTLILAA